jgi:adenosylcobinamide-GDP ribazoletransferase
VAALRAPLDAFARRFAVALRRVTRLDPGAPLHAPTAPDAALERASTRHEPGAAWLVGLLSAFVFALFAVLLRGSPGGPAVAAVAATIATAWLTGATQERALYRCAEALAPASAGADGATSVGVIALVLLLALRLAAIAALGAVSEAGVLAALFAAPVLSRFASLLASYWLATHGEVDRATLRVAALWCLPPLLVMLLAAGVGFAVVAVAASLAGWVALLRVFRQRPAAFDAARAAALQQVCEVVFYVGSSVVA